MTEETRIRMVRIENSLERMRLSTMGGSSEEVYQ
jgi:hypothetical protein